MPNKKREDIARVAREHWLEDDDILIFFRKYTSRLPKELRDMLDDPVFNAGIVVGLVYARSQHTDTPAKTGDREIVRRILEAVINSTKDTPYISLN